MGVLAIVISFVVELVAAVVVKLVVLVAAAVMRLRRNRRET